MNGKNYFIGTNSPPLDARDKVTGRAIYVDDLHMPGMLYGMLLRSPFAHARIKHIDISKAKNLNGVKDIIVGTDIPKIKSGKWQLEPQNQFELPLAIDKVRFIGEEVAAVAALNKEIAKHACELIKVEYEELPALFNVEDSIANGATIIYEEHTDNISLRRKIKYGNLKKGFKYAYYIREDIFHVHAVSHAYIEPCSSIATPDEGNRVIIWTTTETPHIVQHLLASILGLPENYVRVIKPAVGGSFSGKIGLKSWEFCAAFLALRTGRAVKFTLNHEEELAFGHRRHPMSIYSKIGFTKKGELTAKDSNVLLDGGAYNSMGATATFLCGILGTMLYRYPAYRYLGRYVYTNNPPSGAMRGFSAPQIFFATENQMNIAATELNIDPIELRLKNAIDTGYKIPEIAIINSCGLKESLIKIRKQSKWDTKRKEKKTGYGIGIGCYSFISGGLLNSLNHTKNCFASAEIRVFDDGTAHLLTIASSTEYSSDHIFRQILATELGIGIEKIRITTADTTITPKANLGIWNSDAIIMTSNAVLNAAYKIKEMLIPIILNKFNLNKKNNIIFENNRVFVKTKPENGLSFKKCINKALHKRHNKPLIAFGTYPPSNHKLISPAFSFGTQIIEAKVDPKTGNIKIIQIYTAHDSGTHINQNIAEGQLAGALHMGLGYTLMENFITKNGHTLNTSFFNYKIPSAQDIPPNTLIKINTYEPEGLLGTKEIGEGLVSPTAPAITEAIYDATGYRCMNLPIIPSNILDKINKSR